MACACGPERWEKDFVERKTVEQEPHKEEFVPVDKHVSCHLSN